MVNGTDQRLAARACFIRASVAVRYPPFYHTFYVITGEC